MVDPTPSPRSPAFAGSSRAYGAIAAAACLWGTWSLFFRPAQALYPISPAAQSALVCGAVLLIAGPLAWKRSSPSAPRPVRAWVLMGWVGVVDSGNVLCFFAAMQKTSLAVAVLTHYLALPLVAVSAPAVLGEKTSPRAWAALGMGLGGLGLLVEPWRAAPASLVGAGLGAASAVFFALNVLGSKHATRWFPSGEILVWRYPVLIPLLLLFLSDSDRAMLSSTAGMMAMAWVITAGVVVGAGAGLLYYWGLEFVPASHATTLSLLEPLVAVLVGMTVWREVPGVGAALGGLLILIALLLTTRTAREVNRSPGASESLRS